MRTFPIDQIPDEGLPRLSPRRLGRHGVLVTFADCTPYLTARPFQLDELLIVLVRLLTVPGGPLVSSHGIPLVPRLTRLPWSVADKPADALALADIGLWLEFDATAGTDDLDHMRDRVNLGATHMLMTISWQPWWPHAKDLFELFVCHNFADTMLAGLSAVREYNNNNTQQGEET